VLESHEPVPAKVCQRDGIRSSWRVIGPRVSSQSIKVIGDGVQSTSDWPGGGGGQVMVKEPWGAESVSVALMGGRAPVLDNQSFWVTCRSRARLTTVCWQEGQHVALDRSPRPAIGVHPGGEFGSVISKVVGELGRGSGWQRTGDCPAGQATG